MASKHSIDQPDLSSLSTAELIDAMDEVFNGLRDSGAVDKFGDIFAELIKRGDTDLADKFMFGLGEEFSLKNIPLLSNAARRALDFLEKAGPEWVLGLIEVIEDNPDADKDHISDYAAIIYAIIDGYGGASRRHLAQWIAEVDAMKEDASQFRTLRRAVIGLPMVVGPFTFHDMIQKAVAGQPFPLCDEITAFTAYLAVTQDWARESVRDAFGGDALLNLAKEDYARRAAANPA